MKLYTEEQVRAIGEWASQWDLYELDKEFNSKPPMFKEFIDSLTPIELPSDEEIEQRAESYCDEIFSTGMLHGASNHTRQGYIQSAKWMKAQILNQNK